jgi:hypothetical protein
VCIIGLFTVVANRELEANLNIAAYQLVAYLALTLASVTVAATSLIIGFRQNFGWMPKLLVTGIGFSRFEPPQNHVVIVTFEVWNRRKYPIALETAEITYPGATVIELPEKDGWLRWRNRMSYYGDKIRIDPLAFQVFQIAAELDSKEAVEMPDQWPVTVGYFDPVEGKRVELNAFVPFRPMSDRKRS